MNISELRTEINILEIELQDADHIATKRIKKLIDARMRKVAAHELAWCKFNELEEEMIQLEAIGDPHGKIRALTKKRIAIGRTL